MCRFQPQAKLIAMSASSLDDLIRPEMSEIWPKEKLFWFANETAEQQKSPGYMKVEYESSSGIYYGLSSKCYIITNETGSTKRSHKGIFRVFCCPILENS